MRRLAATLLIFAACWGACGESGLPDTPPVPSRTEQFVIYPAPRSFLSAANAADSKVVQLDARLLAVSCERVKQAVLTELAMRDSWRGKIFIVLRHAETADDEVVITSFRFASRWNYRVDLPDAMKPEKFVRALTRVVLLELADRNAGNGSTELPTWLAEGMAQVVFSASTIDLLLKPPSVRVEQFQIGAESRVWTNYLPLARAQRTLAGRQPLTIEELSWPAAAQLDGDAGEVYRTSAHLLVYELLRLKKGRVELREFISALPRRLNWQLSFLEAFADDFRSQLQLEKWWALQCVYFTGRNVASAWTTEESWKKLNEILHPEVQVHVNANEFPLRAEVSLQAIIREWDFLRQSQTLRAKIRQLNDAQLRVAAPLLVLTSQYIQTLDDYLQQMQKAGPLPVGKTQVRPSIKKIVEETVKQLDALDAKAAALRTMPVAQSN